jgi:ABC-type sugar transport system ATPase subunit
VSHQIPQLELRGLEKRFGEVRAVSSLDLNVRPGEFFALLGPSGCGKTTTMRLIAGLEQPSAGQVFLAGREITRLDPADRNVAMVFQDYALYPHMTILENIAYPLKVRNIKASERESRAQNVAQNLRIETLLSRRPAQLSGGQQQRAAVARALVHPSQLLLMDEPLSNLDAQLRFEARTFLKRLQRELNLTVVYVTHDQLEAMALADRMAVMRDGRVLQVGTPLEAYRRPANTFVATFLGQPPMNLLDIHHAQLRAACGTPKPSVLERAEVFGVRPEDVRVGLQSKPDNIQAELLTIEMLGVETILTFEAAGQTVAVRIPGADPPELPKIVYLEFDRERLHYFDKDGERIE